MLIIIVEAALVRELEACPSAPLQATVHILRYRCITTTAMIMLVIRRQVTYQVNAAMSYKPVVSCSSIIALIGHSGITALIKGVAFMEQ